MSTGLAIDSLTVMMGYLEVVPVPVYSVRYIEDETYYCSRCQIQFQSLGSFERHLETWPTHHYCTLCRKDFATPLGLTEHYVQSPYHHYCRRCNLHFDTKEEHDFHKRTSHYYCPLCNSTFDFQQGLHEPNRQKHPYCISCKRVFETQQNLDAHLKSHLHTASAVKCPASSCGRVFISRGDLAKHWEAGTCSSGVNRNRLNDALVRADTSRTFTNPDRLLTGPSGVPRSTVIETRATEASWNGRAFVCVLCHKSLKALRSLDAHLNSPAHGEKIYRCPPRANGCNAHFTTLSALVQHVESGRCGVFRFVDQMRDAFDSLKGRMIA
ncbi:C2H2-type zinc finger protein [Phanerochaete sordida]|uniref:C2H2-type zinc finger protein n=1 Tax=Phanerochaete sordida TaxID=48140 RepID=A0A9P3GRA7_9APHY|nr:C2H2-type zinc finger protein [Phanerochaete sordida]